MTSEDFVSGFYREKENLLKIYKSKDSGSSVTELIETLELSDKQKETLNLVLDEVLTDAFVTMLYGLDGCCSLGDKEQQQFTVLDEDNNQVCGESQEGDIQALTYEYFYEMKPSV